ncbi:PQQ-binding-like beta-propeller repeat protein [Actinomadura gamaensis]|uniref:PQQ-binding-like beta-propeller repeat protein n=1 Tax=Actinomadura gamaensis TaxID=1763541 RepID=A0ABV9UAJ2_9ACTN
MIGVLHALDAASGRERWRHRHSAAAAGVAAGGRWVFVESDGDLWTHDRRTGEIVDGAFPELEGRPVQVCGDILVFQQSGRLGAADLASMAEIFTTDDYVLDAPVAVADGVMVAADRYEGNVSAGGLRAFDAATGRSPWLVEPDDLTAVDIGRSAVAWSRPLPDLPVGAPVVADGLVHTFTRDGAVLGHDNAAGQRLAHGRGTRAADDRSAIPPKLITKAGTGR